jgi:hypothetical protein
LSVLVCYSCFDSTPMKQCAFCPHEGKLSLEHVFGDWLNPLFPGLKTFTLRSSSGEILHRSVKETIDWEAKVVCKKCNETWMSNIESKHAKPILTPLITGEVDIPINQAKAKSIAIFAFKTAVVLDHANRGRPPFFPRRFRYAFRESHFIPLFVQMWMCGFADRGHGQSLGVYTKGTIPPADPLEMYTCTCAIGHFVFQVLAVKKIGRAGLEPEVKFDHLSVPLWPKVPPGFVWPAAEVLRSPEEFLAYAQRWVNVFVLG